MSQRYEPRGEMTSLPEDAGEQMTRYGITRVPAEVFQYRDYRYTNLRDALAQAKHDAKSLAEEPE